MLIFTSIHTNAQLKNADFEDWTLNNQLRYYPTDWPEMEYNYCYRDSVAHSGSYALQVSVWYYYTKSVGIQKFSLSSKPFALNGYYKYTENIMRNMTQNDTVADIANVIAYATKWDTALQRTDTIGYGLVALNGTNTYRPFSCNIQYNVATDIPDSIIIVFDPSLCRRGDQYYMSISPDGYNSFLSVDNISLADIPSDIKEIDYKKLLIYPNPASELIRIGNMGKQQYRYIIIDATGKTTRTGTIDHTRPQIETSSLPPGMYQLLLNGKDNKDETVNSFIKH